MPASLPKPHRWRARCSPRQNDGLSTYLEDGTVRAEPVQGGRKPIVNNRTKCRRWRAA